MGDVPSVRLAASTVSILRLLAGYRIAEGEGAQARDLTQEAERALRRWCALTGGHAENVK